MNSEEELRIQRVACLKNILSFLNINVNQFQLAKYLGILKSSNAKKYSLSLGDVSNNIKHKKAFINLYKSIQLHSSNEFVGPVVFLIQKILNDMTLKSFLEKQNGIDLYIKQCPPSKKPNNNSLCPSFNKTLIKHISDMEERKYLKLFVEMETDKEKLFPAPNNIKISIYDLIKTFQAYQGIHIHYNSIKYITCDMDDTKYEWCKRFYPILQHYLNIAQHIDKNLFHFHLGLVINTFYTSLRMTVEKYFIFLTQIENTLASLLNEKLWLFVQPVLQVFDILNKMLVRLDCTKKRACDYIDVVYHFMNTSTKHGYCAIFKQLFNEIAQPYMDILNIWISEGVIFDIYHEFFIRENADHMLFDFYNDSYNKFVIIQTRIPLFLQADFEVIYKTGKYINIINDCLKATKNCNLESDLSADNLYEPPKQFLDLVKFTPLRPEDVENDGLSLRLEARYNLTSHALFDILVKGSIGQAESLNSPTSGINLHQLFCAIKNYFFVERGDYLTHFMDSAIEELHKPAEAVYPFRLESLLDISLRTSSANVDPLKEHLLLSLCPNDLWTHLASIMNAKTDVRTELPGSSVITGTTESTSSRNTSTKAPQLRSKRDHENPFEDQNELLANTFAHLDIEPTMENNEKTLISKDLLGADIFSLDFRVDWPLNLIVNRSSIAKYQIIFRYLFALHYIENELAQKWQDLTIKFSEIANSKIYKRHVANHISASIVSGSTNIALSFDQRIAQNLTNIISKHACVLLNSMILFVQNLLYYLKYDVLEPQWATFYAKVGGRPSQQSINSLTDPFTPQYFEADATFGDSATTELNVDHVYKAHMELLYNIINSGMLNNTSLFSQIQKCLKICDGFCRFLHSKMAANSVIECWDNILMENLSLGDRIQASRTLRQAVAKHEFRFKNNVCKLYTKLSNNSSSAGIDTNDVASQPHLTSNHNLIHYIYKLDNFFKIYSQSLATLSLVK